MPSPDRTTRRQRGRQSAAYSSRPAPCSLLLAPSHQNRTTGDSPAAGRAPLRPDPRTLQSSCVPWVRISLPPRRPRILHHHQSHRTRLLHRLPPPSLLPHPPHPPRPHPPTPP